MGEMGMKPGNRGAGEDLYSTVLSCTWWRCVFEIWTIDLSHCAQRIMWKRMDGWMTIFLGTANWVGRHANFGGEGSRAGEDKRRRGSMATGWVIASPSHPEVEKARRPSGSNGQRRPQPAANRGAPPHNNAQQSSNTLPFRLARSCNWCPVPAQNR
jgi:hypothetical protein